MSEISRGILGALTISLMLGAVPFAAGRDLFGAQVAAGTNEADVNRATKSDRAAAVKASVEPTQTILLRLDSLSDTSVLVRIPLVRAARDGISTLPPARSPDRKVTVACEPVVSVLTEVAKLLQPGRCIT